MRLVDVKTAIPVLLDVAKNFASITLVSLAVLKNEKINAYREVSPTIERVMLQLAYISHAESMLISSKHVIYQNHAIVLYAQ